MIKKIILATTIFFTSAQANDVSEAYSIVNDSWGYHENIPTIAITSVLLAGLVEGNESRFGKTVWKSIDSLAIGGVITQVGKYSFGRVRPYQETEELKGWFNPGHHSFPSGHTSSITSIVTPFIFEYAEDEPLIHLLWLLPAQQMFGRVNDERHHVTDVIAGFGVGLLSGWIASDLETPLTLSWKKDGIYAGLNWEF